MNVPPSSTGFNWSLVFEWGGLLLGFVFLCYSAIVIKNEKVSYKESAQELIFGNLKLFYPSWWDKKVINENLIKFLRIDTRYDWKSSFEILSSSKNVKLQAKEYLEKENIVLDNSYESFDESDKAEYLIKNESLIHEIEEFYRVESVGTEKDSDRIYLDIVFMKLKNEKNKTYKFISRSSVLNGCVEGPYFEECIKAAELQSS